MANIFVKNAKQSIFLKTDRAKHVKRRVRAIFARTLDFFVAESQNSLASADVLLRQNLEYNIKNRQVVFKLYQKTERERQFFQSEKKIIREIQKGLAEYHKP